MASKEELTNLYEHYRTVPSDIYEHLTVLKQLAKECGSVVEIGKRSVGSTWALLNGLAESSEAERTYLEIEVFPPVLEKLYLSKKLAYENNISFQFIEGNDLHLDLKDRADLLFIDGTHTYCHVTYELEKFAPKINKYIVMHDTNLPWGYQNDIEYQGDYSEYPEAIDRTKKGLSAAVNDFLAKNPGWILAERRFNNHGLTVLKRVVQPMVGQNPNIQVFIHACTITHWKDVLSRQLKRIKDSGLYDAAQAIYLGILGNEDVSSFTVAYPKVHVVFQNPDISLYERPTLLALHGMCCEDPSNNIALYLHTKGVTRMGSTVTDWTMMMEYFLIDRWQDCVAALTNYDVCGVNWQLGPAPHFSGNFWWATGAYLSTLPHEIKSSYLDPEMWLCQNKPNYKCFHSSNVEHYCESYPPSRYVKNLFSTIVD